MKNTTLAATLAVALAFAPGCLLVAGAAIGAGIIYTTGDDTAEVRVESAASTTFAAVREEVGSRGTIDSSDPEAGVLVARVGGSDVTVSVAGEPQGGHSKVTVKARKIGGLGPDIDTAHELAVAVVKRVE